MSYRRKLLTGVLGLYLLNHWIGDGHSFVLIPNNSANTIDYQAYQQNVAAFAPVSISR